MTSPDNTDRAGWAQSAVHHYASLTRSDPREQTVSSEDEDAREHAEEVISDLLGDLRHLSRQLGINFQTMLGRSLGHFTEELAEERADELGDSVTTEEIMDLITPDPWGQAGGK